jgi:hypothetical protein
MKCVPQIFYVKQTFDMIWQAGLLCKLKSNVPDQLYLLLKSYLEERYFQVKIDHTLSDYHFLKAGVPQRSVDWPLVYLIYTADAPTRNDTIIATFADDTAT